MQFIFTGIKKPIKILLAIVGYDYNLRSRSKTMKNVFMPVSLRYCKWSNKTLYVQDYKVLHVYSKKYISLNSTAFMLRNKVLRHVDNKLSRNIFTILYCWKTVIIGSRTQVIAVYSSEYHKFTSRI